ncbi:MAG: DNA-processing protein DprA [Armatimonadetes bacterium]|nr:DNA-processing protein DprA [Armatimonadota bacterium]MDW8122907.1 DNA-processing protein DprA [Armatimonadota bacterium]
MKPEEALLWYRLSRTGLSPERLRILLELLGGPEEIFGASDSTLLRVRGISELHLTKIRQAQRDVQAERDWAKAQAMGAWLLTIRDERYPPLLRRLSDAPVVLNVLGTIEDGDEWAVALVGTRKPKPYGARAAYQIAYELAQAGITVVSGLAEGIDGAAHRGALEAGGRTIAVLGSGLDIVYPRSHRELARKITESGAVITEFPFGAAPKPWHFPLRNRIISGMSLATIVGEAPEGSGALITADWANEQGREVYCVTGPYDDPSYQGNLRLIREGAHPFTSVTDLLQDLSIPPTLARQQRRDRAAPQPAPISVRRTAAVPKPVPELSASEKRLWDAIGHEWKHADDLVRETNLTVGETLSALTTLEMKGLVERGRGNLFRRASNW